MKNAKQAFIPGDEWLYYKFYSGPKTADAILTDFIFPVATNFVKEGLALRWFFIRYGDPKPHLRFRILVKNKHAFAEIIQVINQKTKQLVSSKLIWLVQIDTYQRELQRYGKNSVEILEEIFYHDSVMITKFIDMLDEDGEKYRWQFGIKAIDTLLNDFQLNPLEKLKLVETMTKSYSNEFLMDKSLKLQLDTKFRKNRDIIELLINSDSTTSEIEPALSLLHEKSLNTKLLVKKLLKLNNNGELVPAFNSLVASLIHMLLNRLFKSEQRLHELVLYFFLNKQYKSMLARKKQ